MSSTTCILLGAPVQEGAGRLGCDMGPSAFRAAGLAGALDDLGYQVVDRGNLAPAARDVIAIPIRRSRSLPEIVAWTEAVADAAYRASADGMPIVLGGDHSLAAGTLLGHQPPRRRAGPRAVRALARRASRFPHARHRRAAAICTACPVAYATGQAGFDGFFPPLAAPGEAGEHLHDGHPQRRPGRARRRSPTTGITVHDMRADRRARRRRRCSPASWSSVAAANGMLHVSLDVDFLDPGIAPGVGTTVPGGATFREAHLVMEMLHDSGLVDQPRPRRAQPVPRRARPHRHADGRPRRQPDGPPRPRPPDPELLSPWRRKLNVVPFVSVDQHDEAGADASASSAFWSNWPDAIEERFSALGSVRQDAARGLAQRRTA